MIKINYPQHQKLSPILSSANGPRRNVPQTAVRVETLGLIALISVVVQTVGNHENINESDDSEDDDDEDDDDDNDGGGGGGYDDDDDD